MRKIFLGLLSGVMVLGLTACSGGGNNANTQTAATTQVAETTAAAESKEESSAESREEGKSDLTGKVIGFSQTDSMSSWRTTETDSIKEAVEAAGGSVIVKDAGGDIATQESDIRDLIAANVDFLVVAPLENNGLQGALKEAMDMDIPVILVDRAVDGEPGVHYTTAIASDFVWEGAQCAEAVKAALPDGGKVVIINGGYDSSTSTDRQEGFVNGLTDKFEVVAEQDGSWLMDKAQAVMENIIQANGKDNIDVVFAVTDDMVQGAMNASIAAGIEPGKDVLFVGIDGTRAALEAVKDGTQLASCTCTPFFGPIVVETAEKILNGETVEPAIVNPDILFTKDNVDVEAGF